jgi:hypothetical protein
LLQPINTREYPSNDIIFIQNQQVKEDLKSILLVTSEQTYEITLQSFAKHNRIHSTHCNATKARQRAHSLNDEKIALFKDIST